MHKLIYENVYDIAEDIYDTLKEIDDLIPVISVYGKYDVIRELLECLISNGSNISGIVELVDGEFDNYYKEFVLYLTEDGVSVEKIWHETNEWHEAGYLHGSGNVSFVHSDCSSALLDYVDSDVVFEFDLCDTCDDRECDCQFCRCLDWIDDDETEHLLEADAAYIINGKLVGKKEFDDRVAEFGKKFEQLKNVIDIEFEKIRNYVI